MNKATSIPRHLWEDRTIYLMDGRRGEIGVWVGMDSFLVLQRDWGVPGLFEELCGRESGSTRPLDVLGKVDEDVAIHDLSEALVKALLEAERKLLEERADACARGEHGALQRVSDGSEVCLHCVPGREEE